MTESRAYPTMINGMPTMAMRIELLLLLGPYNRFSFSFKDHISDSEIRTGWPTRSCISHMYLIRDVSRFTK